MSGDSHCLDDRTQTDSPLDAQPLAMVLGQEEELDQDGEHVMFGFKISKRWPAKDRCLRESTPRHGRATASALVPRPAVLMSSIRTPERGNAYR
jgi:hypothetical protein